MKLVLSTFESMSNDEAAPVKWFVTLTETIPISSKKFIFNLNKDGVNVTATGEMTIERAPFLVSLDSSQRIGIVSSESSSHLATTD